MRNGSDGSCSEPGKGSARSSERGQGSVEFTIFIIFLILCIFLLVQLAWIGVQKWQFNHFAAYAARVWTVNKSNESPEASLIKVQIVGIVRWKLASTSYVKIMWADSQSDGKITYNGIAPIFPLFKPFIGDTLTGISIPSEVSSIIPVSIPSSGFIRFQTSIPMDHEPNEDPDKYDNDR